MSRPRLFSLIIALLALLVLLAGCRDGEDAQFAQDEQLLTTCSEECATHGQCGAMPDDTRVVLAMEGGPAVSLHDRFFTEGTTVTVVEISPRELIAARDGAPLINQATPFPHVFYRVSGDNKTAWVSQWCLARP